MKSAIPAKGQNPLLLNRKIAVKDQSYPTGTQNPAAAGIERTRDLNPAREEAAHASSATAYLKEASI